MYLLTITNLDYAMMAALFFIVLAIAYKFRRANPNSVNFLLMDQLRLPVSFGFASLLSFGVIEFIVVSSFGAYYGLAGLFLLIPVFLICALLFDRLSSQSFFWPDPLSLPKLELKNKVAYLCYAFFMLLVAGASISIVVTMFKSLLGWQFANSTLSLVGIAMVALIIGGTIATTYNQGLGWLVVTILMSVVSFYAYQKIGSGNFIESLKQVAVDNKLNQNIYLIPSFSFDTLKQIWMIVILSMVIFVINPLYVIRRNKMSLDGNKIKSSYSRVCQLLLLSLMVVSGVLALASPAKSSLIEGKKVITQQTRLNDGSIGYVVRAVPSNQEAMQKGLIPALTNTDTTEQADNSPSTNFDYASAAIVLVTNALSPAFICLFILVLLFYKSITESLSFATILLIRGFYAPLYNKTGEELENLWASRVLLFTLTVVCISIGLVMFKFLDLYYTLLIIFSLGLPIVFNLIGFSRHWVVDLLAFAILVVIFLGVNISDVPSAFQLFYFKDIQTLAFTLSLGVTGYYVLTFVGISFLRRRDW